MLIDKSHKKWMVFTVVATLAALVMYVVYSRASYMGSGTGPSGSSWPGLAYGIAGFVLMLFCGLLGARKKVRVWRLGRAQTWLKAHIWLGLLAFPLILFHAGMVLGHQLTLWLMILFILVEISGILGVILQNRIPHSMMEHVRAEVTFEQIPFVIDKLGEEATAIVSTVCGPLEAPKDGEAKDPKHAKKVAAPLEGNLPLKNFYFDEVKPFLGVKFRSKSSLAKPERALAVFTHVRTLLPAPLHEALGDVQSICDERRELAIQERLHFWLHTWEYCHVPLSYLLLALSFYHVIVSTFGYSGFLSK